MIDWFKTIWDDFYRIMIDGGRGLSLIRGLGNTLLITIGAAIIGVFLGILVAAVRVSWDKQKDEMKMKGGIGYYILGFFNGVSNVYLTVIRGTPVVVQLMIFFFVIFISVKNGTPIAILAFGINSGAYVAEIFRGGIMSIDQGQFEAGRSLGFSYVQTMFNIIIPQAFKAVLPTLCNEFITLLKETSVAGYVGVIDLTKSGNLIAGRMYTYFIPLLSVAAIYLAMVMILTFFVGKLERRLRKSER